VFSLMLWAPSWGGMLNGLLTLRGAWDKLRTDPVLKFFAAGVTFYGMATFEGPLMAIKSVNAISHYTDWTIGHVHSGTLGWNGFMAAGLFYWLAPRLWKTKLFSVRLADIHFWTGMTGILLYIASMWVAGISEGVMLNGITPDGVLAYPNFLDVVTSTHMMMVTRVIGGALYLSGYLLMIYNLTRTIWGAVPVNGVIEVVPEPSHTGSLKFGGTFFNAPVLYSLLLVLFACLWMLGPEGVMLVALPGLILTVISAIVHFESSGAKWGQWYEQLLASYIPFSALTLVAVLIGGMVQILPTLTLERTTGIDGIKQKLYTPLELAGRDLYIREGCYLCHSQQIRPFASESMRYGEPSKLGESMYDYPFQWGSKRTGPDLARVGGKYPNIWHYRHMNDPRSTSPGSIMPRYPWLFTQNTDYSVLPNRLRVQRRLGVPFPQQTDAEIVAAARQQAEGIAADLRTNGVQAVPDREIIALTAYLQKMGQSEKVPAATANP